MLVKVTKIMLKGQTIHGKVSNWLLKPAGGIRMFLPAIHTIRNYLQLRRKEYLRKNFFFTFALLFSCTGFM